MNAQNTHKNQYSRVSKVHTTDRPKKTRPTVSHFIKKMYLCFKIRKCVLFFQFVSAKIRSKASSSEDGFNYPKILFAKNQRCRHNILRIIGGIEKLNAQKDIISESSYVVEPSDNV